jgi:uncharacterized protein YfiM (DUF2279 family)
MSASFQKIHPVVVALGLWWPAPARADHDPWWSRDKAVHLSVSAVMSGGWYLVLTLLGDDSRPVRAVLSTSLALLPGLAKEIYDDGQPDNHFSGKDMLFNLAGALLGTGLALTVDLLWPRAGPRRAWIAPAGPGLAVGGRF